MAPPGLYEHRDQHRRGLHLIKGHHHGSVRIASSASQGCRWRSNQGNDPALRSGLIRPGRSFVAPDPVLSTTFFAAVLMLLSGWFRAVVVSWLPRGGWYGFSCCAGRMSFRDGFEGSAASFLAMTRPLIERRDKIAG